MRRPVAIIWHASSIVLAGLLYFFFVLPRWNELTGDWSHTLGTVMRILCGIVIAVSALPVLLTLQRTSKPEYSTPQLALSLRTWSIALHVVAGVLIASTAVSEIWLSLAKAGTWLFGIYGAAAGVTLLAVLAFYLAFLAELPPPPPKPLKPQGTGRRGHTSDADTAAPATPEVEAPAETEADIEAATEADSDVNVNSDTEAGNAEDAESEETVDEASSDEETTDADSGNAPEGKLRNRRSGKGLFGGSRGGASLD